MMSNAKFLMIILVNSVLYGLLLSILLTPFHVPLFVFAILGGVNGAWLGTLLQ